MLAYVDSLCAALLARNQAEVRRLLSLPQAQRLPHRVREEAVAIAKGKVNSFMAPVHALHFYYQLTHLIDESTDVPAAEAGRPGPDRQIELPLRAVGSG